MGKLIVTEYLTFDGTFPDGTLQLAYETAGAPTYGDMAKMSA